LLEERTPISRIRMDGMKRKFLQGEQGAAVVEFAITATVLLTIVFGIIEFGVLMFDKHILTNACREGARAGIIMQLPRVSDTEIEDVVRAYAREHMVSFSTDGGLDFGPWPGESPEFSVEPVGPRSGPLFGTELVVTVKYPFNFLLLSGLGLGPITLTAETRMRME
jgi:hypothetical protein